MRTHRAHDRTISRMTHDRGVADGGGCWTIVLMRWTLVRFNSSVGHGGNTMGISDDDADWVMMNCYLYNRTAPALASSFKPFSCTVL
jgi:hypothetical protein